MTTHHDPLETPPRAAVGSRVTVPPAGTHATQPHHSIPGGYPTSTDPHGKAPEQIEREIRATRGQMDQTLDALKEKLQPRHLIDELLDSFGVRSERSAGETVSAVSSRVGRAVKQHPVPAALAAAAALWYAFDSDETDERRREYAVAPQGDPYLYGDPYAATVAQPAWRQETVAYHDHHRHDDEEGWTEAAAAKLEEIKASIADGSRSAADRIKETAGSLVSVSGHDRDAIHSRWADLKEHSGSFVDARTGEPYDDSYGQEWRRLSRVEFVSQADYENDRGMLDAVEEKGESILESIGETLGDAKLTVKQKVAAATALLSDGFDSLGEKSTDYSRRTAAAVGSAGRSTADAAARAGTATYDAAARAGSATYDGVARFGSATRDAASRAGSATYDGVSRAGSATYDAATSAGASIADGANRAAGATVYGARVAKRKTAEAYGDYPLACGAAAVGFGLLAGLLLPRTRYEDEQFGRESDEFLAEAQRTGEQLVEQGKQVAAATADAALTEAERQGIAPEQLKQKAEATVEQVKGQVEQTVEQAKATAEQTIEQARQTVAEKANEAAGTVKGAAEDARDQAEQTDPRNRVHSIAEKVEAVAATAAETAAAEAKKAKDELTD